MEQFCRESGKTIEQFVWLYGSVICPMTTKQEGKIACTESKYLRKIAEKSKRLVSQLFKPRISFKNKARIF